MTRIKAPIENLAAVAIGDEALAASWLGAPSPLFGGISPGVASTSPEGRNRVRQQLAWFAGHGSHDEPSGDSDYDSITDIALDRAGTGPEHFLSLSGDIARLRRAAEHLRLSNRGREARLSRYRLHEL